MSSTLFEQYKASLRRGHLAALEGQLDEALEAYRAASRLVPERALPVASEGTVLHRLDRWPEAAEAFDRALRLAPDDEATLLARGTAREQRGMRSGAADDFERLAFVLDVGGRAAEAAEIARRAGRLDPSSTREALAGRLAAAASQRSGHAPAGPARIAPPPADKTSAADLGAIESEALAASTAALNAAAPAAPIEPPVVATAPAPDGNQAAEAEAVPAIAPARAAEASPDTMSDVAAESGPDGSLWPAIDLPSSPLPPIVGPPPDPEALMADAAAHIDAGDTGTARDLMLTAATVHRSAGRIDAALEACLQLLGTAPGDPQVHLAIANLQLDRGWTGLATEKMNLLLRLTSLTGDTQAEADVHGLASERLRDAPVGPAATR